MLSHEWRELEAICQRISELRDRHAYARRTKNQGLLEGLKKDLALAQRVRERLVQHISAHLGSAATERHRSPPTELHLDVPVHSGAMLGTGLDEGPPSP